MATGIRRLYDPAGIDEHGNPVTETVRDRILRNTSRGLPPEIAAQATGISPRTFRLWVQAGQAALNEIDADPQVELTDEQRIAAAFATDVDASIGSWLGRANDLLEGETLGRRIVVTKETVDAVGGVIERSVTTREEPGELGRLTWRMGKVSPVYGRERVELTGLDGGPVEVDIGERLASVLADIAATIRVDGNVNDSNGHGESARAFEDGER